MMKRMMDMFNFSFQLFDVKPTYTSFNFERNLEVNLTWESFLCILFRFVNVNSHRVPCKIVDIWWIIEISNLRYQLSLIVNPNKMKNEYDKNHLSLYSTFQISSTDVFLIYCHYNVLQYYYIYRIYDIRAQTLKIHEIYYFY